MKNQIIILFVLLLILVLGCTSQVKHQNNSYFSENYNFTKDWRAEVMKNLCSKWKLETQYVEGIPICYNNRDKTYVAYSLGLEAVIRKCLKEGCPCNEKIISKGLPEILEGNKNVCVIFFWGKGCPHCAREKPMLEYFHKKYNITVFMYEVYYNNENQEAFENACKIVGIQCEGVPTTIIGKYIFVGVLGDDELAYLKNIIK